MSDAKRQHTTRVMEALIRWCKEPHKGRKRKPKRKGDKR